MVYRGGRGGEGAGGAGVFVRSEEEDGGVLCEMSRADEMELGRLGKVPQCGVEISGPLRQSEFANKIVHERACRERVDGSHCTDPR